MVNFPVSLDTLTNPTSSSSTLGHADLHSKVNDIVEALMAKVGINNSNDTSSIDYILRQKASDSAVVHKNGDEEIFGLKTFHDVVNINGLLSLNNTAGERYTEMKFHSKNQANNGGVDWMIYTDADNGVIGNRKWALWGYPLKNSDGSIGGYESFIIASFPTYDGNTTYTKLVEVNTDLNINGKVKGNVFIGSVKQNTSHTANVVMNVNSYNEYDITAQAGALLFSNPTGTPVNGQKLLVRIKDNGTARALTYDTQFASGSGTLPSTTIISKKMWIGFEWDSTDNKWYCIASGSQP